jgi:hypothetical protein
MTIPAVDIFSSIIEVPLPDSFVLDSADDGILDTNKLFGFTETLLDVPIRSIVIDRGKSRELDRFRAGTATVVFNNFDRVLDPLNESSPFYGEIVPRQRIKIYANDIPVFSGVINDWNIPYDITNYDFAIATAADAFTVLANFAFDSAVTPIAETPADRLKWVLDIFNYQGDYLFLGGTPTLGSYQVDSGVQALDYMYRVAKSDRSSLFVSPDGVLKLVGIFDSAPTTKIFFSDDGVGIPYMSLSNQYGDELLYNRVIASSPAGSVSLENAESIAAFEVSTLDLDDLLLNSVSQLTAVAGSYLSLYAMPKVRFTGLSVELAGLSEADTNSLLSLDLADQVTVRKTFKVGSPLVIDRDLMVIGIRHNISVDSHVIEFVFDESEFGDAFRLDDAVYGILDGDQVLA